MTRWTMGEAEIELLLARGALEKVSPSRPQADALVAQARTHVVSSRSLTEADPAGAYQLAYDAARKTLAGVLANQGLRATSAGGHVAVSLAGRAQLGDHVRWFDRMRRRRNDLEYPDETVPAAVSEDVDEAIADVERLIDVVDRLLDQMGVF